MRLPSPWDNENGAALISGLLLLLVLTILGVASMQGTTLQERMAGNLEQQDRAFQRAEAGLRDAERWLATTLVSPSEFGNSGGLYSPMDPGDPPWKSPDFWKTTSNYVTYKRADHFGNLPLGDRPRYIIELLDAVKDADADSEAFTSTEGFGTYVYRITSRGVSPNGRAVVLLQTTYVR